MVRGRVLVAALLLAGCARPDAPAEGTATAAMADAPAVAQVGPLPFCRDATGPVLVFAGFDGMYETVDLFSVDAAGAVRRLTSDQSSDAPSFTADGTHILFSRSLDLRAGGGAPSPGTSVWTMDAGGGSEQLVAEASLVGDPQLSPDGTRIAFSGLLTADEVVDRLHVVAFDGGRPAPLSVDPGPPSANGSYSDYSPAWSDTGDRIAFARGGIGGGPNQVWVHDLATGRGRVVYESLDLPLGRITWTADDGELIFVQGLAGTDERRLIAVDVATGSTRTVAVGVTTFADSGDGLLYLTENAPRASDYTLSYRTDPSAAPREQRLVLPGIHLGRMSARACPSPARTAVARSHPGEAMTEEEP